MVTVLCGKPGDGKTLYAVWQLAVAACAGRPCATNIRLTPEHPGYDRICLLDDDEGKCPVYEGKPPNHRAFWHYLPPGTFVVIDEADWYFDCTDHSAMARDVRQYLKQHRKRGDDIVFIVQNVQNLYVRIRRLAAKFIVAEWNYRTERIWRWFPITWSRFLRSEFSSDLFAASTHLGDGHFSYGEAQRLFTWYRTDQLIGDTHFYQAMGGRHGVGGSASDSAGRVSESGRGIAEHAGIGAEAPG